MRLQVEIAAASWISARSHQLAQDAGRAALGERDPLAQLERRGLVGDAEREELSSRRHPLSSASWLAWPVARPRSASSPSSRSMRASFAAMIAT